MNDTSQIELEQYNTLLKAPTTIDILHQYRACLHCGKRFMAITPNFICCSWHCSHAHRKVKRLSAHEDYLAYPF